jgi:hypothetical protein
MRHTVTITADGLGPRNFHLLDKDRADRFAAKILRDGGEVHTVRPTTREEIIALIRSISA